MKMLKIILLKDVPELGRKYDIKNVSGGYARNFLFRRGLAMPATEKKIKEIERIKTQTGQKKAVDENILKKNIDLLEGIKIAIGAKANEKGHLFSSVHGEKIAEALKEQKNIDIPAELLEVNHPIKTVGEHKIKVGGKEFVLEINPEN